MNTENKSYLFTFILLLFGLVTTTGCMEWSDPLEGTSEDSSTDADTDTDTDTDTDADTDTDTDTDTDSDTGGTSPDCVVYVNKSATGNEDGSSWEDAFDHPNPALVAAEAAGSGCEVWVAAGTYYARDLLVTDTIDVPNGAQLYGGFSGTEIYREQRDPKAHISVFSGFDRLRTERARHVVTVASGPLPTRIDGFVITEALDGTTESAAGIFVSQGVLTVQNCVFFNNRDDARCNGGALEAWGTAIEVLDSVFQNNFCYPYPYNHGGGAIFFGDPPAYGGATVERCAFVANSSTGVDGGAGGGIRSLGTAVSLYSSLFVANIAKNSGGAFHLDTLDTMAGVTLVKNSAGAYGAAEITCCDSYEAYGLISWGNVTTGSQGVDDHIGDFLSYKYSTVEGGITGSGTYNVDADPLFASYPSAPTGTLESVVFDASRLQTTLTDDDANWTPGHYAGQVVHILGIAARWLYVVDNTETSLTVWEEHAGVVAGTDYELYDFRLQEDSHCIDAGHGDFQSATDYYGNERHNAPTEDLGAGDPDYADHGAFEWIQ